MLTRGIPRMLMAVAQKLGSDGGIVMKLKSISHNRNEKVKAKLPFLGWESNLQKDVHLFERVSRKSKM